MSPEHPWVLPPRQGQLIKSDNKNNAPFPKTSDPAQILRFLDEDDIDQLKFCSRECSFLTFLFVETRYAKSEARPALDPDEWDCEGYATRGAKSNATGSRVWSSMLKVLMQPPSQEREVVRIDKKDLSVSKFRECYEVPSRPVNIQGICDTWEAGKVWSIQNFLDRFGENRFRYDDNFGEEIKLSQYLSYVQRSSDDAPLGIYDSQFASVDSDDDDNDDDNESVANSSNNQNNNTSRNNNSGGDRAVLANEYSVPEYFAEDLFGIEGMEDERPPWRWILVGMPRSGTELHIDPIYTSAWVSLLQGRKRWCMFPPGTPTDLIGSLSSDADDDHHIPEAIKWFRTYYPGLQRNQPKKNTSVVADASGEVTVGVDDVGFAGVDKQDASSCQTSSSVVDGVAGNADSAQVSTGMDELADDVKQVDLRGVVDQKSQTQQQQQMNEGLGEKQDFQSQPKLQAEPVLPTLGTNGWPIGVPAPLEILQEAGDTVFVPAGWAHIVINLEPTLTITHNYASRYHVADILSDCERKEPELGQAWREALSARPDLASLVPPHSY